MSTCRYTGQPVETCNCEGGCWPGEARTIRFSMLISPVFSAGRAPMAKLVDPPKPAPLWVMALMRTAQVFGFALMLASLLVLIGGLS